MHGKVSMKAEGAGGVRVPSEAVEGSLGLNEACPVRSLGGLILATALIPKAPSLGRSLPSINPSPDLTQLACPGALAEYKKGTVLFLRTARPEEALDSSEISTLSLAPFQNPGGKGLVLRRMSWGKLRT